MNKINILLIEDNFLHLRLIEKLVEDISNEFVAVSTLKDGCEQFNQRNFDILLLDLNLPDSQGSETYINVLPCCKDVPVILITGREDEKLALELIREGAQDYISKPNLSCQLLEKAIYYAIERYALLQDLRRQKEQLERAEKERTRLYNDLLQSNEFLRRSVMESPLGIRIVAEGGRLILVNRALLDIYGYENVDELKNIPVTERYTPESHARHEERRAKRQQGREKYPSKYEISIVRKDGEVRHLLVYRTELIWEGEKHYQVLYVDNTERKKLLQVVEERNETLRRVNAEKDKFLSIVAHDLKGPLGSFVSATELLSEEILDIPDEEVVEVIDSLKHSANNLYGLLENLLNWGRMKRDGIRFNPEKSRLKRVMDACSGTLVDAARRKGVDLITTIPDEMEIYADRNMLNTVLRNMISNAVKFTPRGGRIEMDAFGKKDHAVELIISDSGVGMHPEEVSKLFHFSGMTARKGTNGEMGTGLGLIICKEFVEKHGGKIRVKSEVGSGTTFFLTFPDSEKNNQ